MKAVILAGGKGRRLAPYTTVFPKPLVPVEDRPVVEILVGQLRHYGFKEVTFSVGYLAELIEAYFSTQPQKFEGLKISYVREKNALGTAAPLKLIDNLNETFLVVNGDVLTTLNFKTLVDFHRRNEAVLTVATHRRQVKIDLGVVRVDTDNVIYDYIEKPTSDYLVSMGVYVYEPRALDFVAADQHFDFPDLVLRLIAAGEKVCSYESDDFWLDIGNPQDYEKAVGEFAKRRAEFLVGD